MRNIFIAIPGKSAEAIVHRHSSEPRANKVPLGLPAEIKPKPDGGKNCAAQNEGPLSLSLSGDSRNAAGANKPALLVRVGLRRGIFPIKSPDDGELSRARPPTQTRTAGPLFPPFSGAILIIHISCKYKREKLDTSRLKKPFSRGYVRAFIQLSQRAYNNTRWLVSSRDSLYDVRRPVRGL